MSLLGDKFRVIDDAYLPDGFGNDRLVAEAGDIVYRWTGPTYGVITPDGMAVSHDGTPPFFEVAWRNLERVMEGDTE